MALGARYHLIRGLRATIRQLEILKRHQPERAGELSRRQRELAAKIARLQEKGRAT